MKKLIGIAGKAGSGKDTVAKAIKEGVDYYRNTKQTTITHFASGIYEALDKWLQLPPSYFNRDLKELPLPLYVSGEKAVGTFTKLLPIMREITQDKYDKAVIHSCVMSIYGYIWKLRTEQNNPEYNNSSFVLVSPRELLQLFNCFTAEVDKLFWGNLAVSKFTEAPLQIFADVRTKAEAAFIKDSGGLLIYVERDCVDIPLSTHVSESFQSYLKENADIAIMNNDTIDTLRQSISLNLVLENHIYDRNPKGVYENQR